MHDSIPHLVGVTVAVPARLHLGFFDLSETPGRRFGGMGLAVDDLKTSITIRRARRTGPFGRAEALHQKKPATAESDRALRYLQAMEQALAVVGSHELSVAELTPAHAGLGSGTQLALAVAAGLRRLHGLPLDVEADALTLGRGSRSGIGIGLFHRGGLVVDGGHGDRPGAAPIISHLPFPDSWRVILVLEPGRRGVHGADEATTFATLPPMSEADAAHICRLVLMKALPAIAERDLANFGAAVTEMQARLGDHFASRQGGARFTSPDVAAVLETLAGAGAAGIGQSSWGPTGFAFAPSAAAAERLVAMARTHPRSRGLDIRVCRGLNRGAEIVAHAESLRDADSQRDSQKTG